MARELERHGARHFTLPLEAKFPLTLRRNARRLAALIQAEGVDLIHARSRAPAWSALFAARRTRRPFVTTFHSPYGENAIKHWWNTVMAKGDQVIAISDWLAEHVRRHFRIEESRLTVVPRGVDLALFDPERVSAERMAQLARAWRLPDGCFVVMLPGRLTRWKGQAVLIEALARLGRRDVVAVLVGDPQGRDAYVRELERLAEKQGLAGAVRIVGHCRDMPAAYMLADVAVSASTEPEGFGRVAAEAQAMGRPVIATDHGGARETVLAGRTGWLIPPGDAEALAAALAAGLAMTAEDRCAVAVAARAHVAQNFSVELMCARTLSVYERALAGR
jgi:glycosyltransferase involved in cell wall biosynthesis